jgi:Beta-lactamase
MQHADVGAEAILSGGIDAALFY